VKLADFERWRIACVRRAASLAGLAYTGAISNDGNAPSQAGAGAFSAWGLLGAKGISFLRATG